MEKLAQSMASGAEASPAVAALTKVRSQPVASMPHLIKAGRTDSTAPVAVIEHFHGTGLVSGTGPVNGAGRFGGDRRHKDAGQLDGVGRLSGTTLPDGTGRLNSTGALNRAKQLIGQAKGARAAESTGAKATGAKATGAKATVQRIQRPHGLRPEPVAVSGLELGELLEDAAALLDSARLSVPDEVRLLGFVEAADFAGRVEEMSRSVEYLQVVAAQAVERTRRE
ncbi:hypothetical protein LDP00_06310, partial [Paenarthrobacter aurescens]|nr:hypothetical protein [Paenarthrobacter aurescens]